MIRSVLVLNSGSSSLKYQLVAPADGTVIARGIVEQIGESDSRSTHWDQHDEYSQKLKVRDHAAAMQLMLASFNDHGPDLAASQLCAVGHRVVHGGDEYVEPTVVTDEVCSKIKKLSPLAPLHNPANLTGIDVARDMFRDVPHVAVFDTAFHSTIPPHAFHYAVPPQWYRDYRVRRYGFHGTSHAYVARRASALLGIDQGETNVIVLHLGNGASASAVKAGRCIDTSMGMTPLEGLMMGTRSGDLDPAIVGYLNQTASMAVADIDAALNHDSGLLGITGENDMRNVLHRASEGDESAVLGRDMYCYRVRKYIGGYLAAIGRADAVVFTGGVGEHSAQIRWRCLEGLDNLGIELDSDRNNAGETRISSDESKVSVLVIPTNEELEIAEQCVRTIEDLRL